MPEGITLATAKKWHSDIASSYLQIHTGDPGVALTANIAPDTQRALCSLSEPDENGVMTSTGDFSRWDGISAAYDVVYFTGWDTPDAGTGTGLFAAKLLSEVSVVEGDVLRMGNGFRIQLIGVIRAS